MISFAALASRLVTSSGRASYAYIPATLGRMMAVGMAESSEQFTFFFGADSPFSQWHTAEFEVGDETYNCAEQFMMHQKAVLFGDAGASALIMASDSPREQKALGRSVKNFDEHIWGKKCRDIVKQGNLAKFSQNKDLYSALMETSGTTLVEAAPRDRVWGIGLSAKNWKAKHRQHWRGKNLLGEILTQVREELAQQDKTSTAGQESTQQDKASTTGQESTQQDKTSTTGQESTQQDKASTTEQESIQQDKS